MYHHHEDTKKFMAMMIVMIVCSLVFAFLFLKGFQKLWKCLTGFCPGIRPTNPIDPLTSNHPRRLSELNQMDMHKYHVKNKSNP